MIVLSSPSPPAVAVPMLSPLSPLSPLLKVIPNGDRFSARRCRYYRVRGHCSRPAFSSGCAATCFGRYGYHRSSFSAFLDERARHGALLVARAEDSLGFERPFSWLSGALLPDGRRKGAVPVEELLEPTATKRGLLLMSSTRHGAAEFAAAARMLALSGRELAIGALLLVCNNSTLGDDSLARWLAFFRSPPLLRMWVRTRNLGYFCGNLHALAASVRIWSHFPWVVHLSGPDSLLLPNGAALLSALIEREQQRGGHWAQRTAYLGDRFPAPRGHIRFSMDAFVFWPRAMSSAWASAARWCLQGFGPDDVDGAEGLEVDPHPEVLLNTMRLRHNLSYRLIPGHHGSFGRAWKLKATRPLGSHVWHSHNVSAVNRWLDFEEQASRLHVTRGSQGGRARGSTLAHVARAQLWPRAGRVGH